MVRAIWFFLSNIIISYDINWHFFKHFSKNGISKFDQKIFKTFSAILNLNGHQFFFLQFFLDFKLSTYFWEVAHILQHVYNVSTACLPCPREAWHIALSSISTVAHYSRGWDSSIFSFFFFLSKLHFILPNYLTALKPPFVVGHIIAASFQLSNFFGV